jgi:hypothetical protein
MPTIGELDGWYDEQVNVALAGLARFRRGIARKSTTVFGTDATTLSRHYGKENIRTSGLCYLDDGSYIETALVAS